MNNLDITKFSFCPNQATYPIQNISSFSNDLISLFQRTINFIVFGNNLGGLPSKSISRLTDTINYILVCLENLNIYDDPNWINHRLFNSENIKDFVPLIKSLESSSLTEEIKDLSVKICCSRNNKELIFNSIKIYYIALNGFFTVPMAFPTHPINIDLRNSINQSYEKILATTDLNERLKTFFSTFKLLFDKSLQVLFQENFSKKSLMQLDKLMYLLNFTNINLEETSLLDVLSNEINDENKLPYNYLFHGILKAFKLLPKTITFCEITKTHEAKPNLLKNSFLNLKLLDKIKEIAPRFKDNLPFNIEIALLDYPDFDIHEKIKILNSIYFEKKSLEEISNDKIYSHIILYFINSNINGDEFIFLMNYFFQYYAREIFDDYYSRSISSLFLQEKFLLLDRNALQNLISTAISHVGYTKSIANLINDLNVFSTTERIKFLLSKKTKIDRKRTIEDFLVNYSDTISMDSETFNTIFSRFIDLFENRKIPAHLITLIFEWIESSQEDLLLSEILKEDFSMQLLSKFKMEALSLIPKELLNNSLCMKIYEYLKSINFDKFNDMTIADAIQLIKNYTSYNLDFIPNKFSILPPEIKYNIASYLNLKDIQSLCSTSKSNLEIFKEDLYDPKDISLMFKKIFSYLFYQERNNLYYNNKPFNKPINKIKIENGIDDNILQIIQKLESKNTLTLNELKNSLELFQYIISKGAFFDLVQYKPDDWNFISFEEIDTYSDVKKSFYDLINQVFTLTDSNNSFFDVKSFIYFLNSLEIKIPSSLTDFIIINHADSIKNYFRAYHGDDSTFEQKKLQTSNFINYTFLENFILHHNELHCEPLFRTFFYGTKKHLDKDFIDKFLSNSIHNLRNLFIGLRSSDYYHRIDYIDTLLERHDIPDNWGSTWGAITDLLSYTGTLWINANINFFALKHPLWFISNCINNTYGLSIELLSDTQKLLFINQTGKLFGYSKMLHCFIERSQLNISNSEIFKCAAIHPKSDFCELAKKFKPILKTNPLNITFDHVKTFTLVYSENKSTRSSAYQKQLNFIYNLIKLDENQCIELLEIIINNCTLSSLSSIGKSLFCREYLNQEAITSIIQNRLIKAKEKEYFRKNYKIVETLIGKKNAEELMNQISLKRTSRPTKTTASPQTKRKK